MLGRHGVPAAAERNPFLMWSVRHRGTSLLPMPERGEAAVSLASIRGRAMKSEFQAQWESFDPSLPEMNPHHCFAWQYSGRRVLTRLSHGTQFCITVHCIVHTQQLWVLALYFLYILDNLINLFTFDWQCIDGGWRRWRVDFHYQTLEGVGAVYFQLATWTCAHVVWGARGTWKNALWAVRKVLSGAEFEMKMSNVVARCYREYQGWCGGGTVTAKVSFIRMLGARHNRKCLNAMALHHIIG